MTNIKKIILSLCLILFAGVKSHATTLNVEPLSYFQKGEHGYEWILFSPTQDKVLHTIKLIEEPLTFMLEEDGDEAIVVDQNAMWKVDFSNQEVTNVGAGFKGAGNIIGIWRDKTTKVLNIATMETYLQEKLILKNGKSYMQDSKGNQIEVLLDPEWGTHALIKIFSYNSVLKKWEQNQALPTKTEAGDTPGVSVLKSHWNEMGYSLLKLKSRKHCRGYGDLFTGRLCSEDKGEAELRKTILSMDFPKCELNNHGYIKDRWCQISAIKKLDCETCNYVFIHVSVLGDRLHAAAPFYLMNKKNGSIEKLEGHGLKKLDTVLIQQNGIHVAIENKKKNEVVLLDLASGMITSRLTAKDTIFLPVKSK